MMFFLHPYSHEYNPVEQVWQWTKETICFRKTPFDCIGVSKGTSRSSFTTEDMENLALILMLALVYGNNYLYRYMRLCLEQESSILRLKRFYGKTLLNTPLFYGGDESKQRRKGL
jgi:hypothetical protein